jgi:hypothetical protein
VTGQAKTWSSYIVIVGSILIVAYVLFDLSGRARPIGPVATRRLDRVCLSIRAPLERAAERLARPETVEAGRDIAVVIAPVVAQCTGVAAHQSRLDGLATSDDAARDLAVVRGVLAEIASPK